MPTQEKNQSESSTSMPSVREKTRKTRETWLEQNASSRTYDLEEVVSPASASRLSEAFEDTDIRLSLENSVAFHMAKNIVHLRRFRGQSQTELAEAMGTSQSAVARLESGEENVTMNTAERAINALNGRFRVKISPAEEDLSWLDAGGWTLKAAAYMKRSDVEQVLIGLERTNWTLAFSADAR